MGSLITRLIGTAPPLRHPCHQHIRPSSSRPHSTSLRKNIFSSFVTSIPSISLFFALFLFFCLFPISTPIGPFLFYSPPFSPPSSHPSTAPYHSHHSSTPAHLNNTTINQSIVANIEVPINSYTSTNSPFSPVVPPFYLSHLSFQSAWLSSPRLPHRVLPPTFSWSPSMACTKATWNGMSTPIPPLHWPALSTKVYDSQRYERLHTNPLTFIRQFRQLE